MRSRVLAAFRAQEEVREAVRALREAGVPASRLDVLSPVPVEGIDGLLEARRTPVYPAALVAGVVSLLSAFALQEWIAVVRNPFSAGGRPLHSVLAWVPVSLEATILGASIATVAAFLAATRLPAPWHPALEVDGVEQASRDRYVVEVTTDRLDEVRRTLQELGAEWVRTWSPP